MPTEDDWVSSEEEGAVRSKRDCNIKHEMISCNTWFDYLGQKVL